MDQSRLTRWKRASNALFLIRPEIVGVARMLGKIDAQLAEVDEELIVIRERLQHVTSEQWTLVEDTAALAHLWTLGAYELVRTIDQKLRHSGAVDEGVRAASREVKRIFERVRIPMAKFEVPRHGDQEDFGQAHTALILGHGLGWKVGPNCVVARHELSDKLLSFLESLRHVARDA